MTVESVYGIQRGCAFWSVAVMAAQSAKALLFKRGPGSRCLGYVVFHIVGRMFSSDQVGIDLCVVAISGQFHTRFGTHVFIM
jgi:hypothetical protein